jgi:uncharacterized protein (DUF983 family)
MVTFVKEDAKTIAVVAIAFIVFGAALVAIAIGWEAGWVGVMVAIPGALIAGTIFVVLRKGRIAQYDENGSQSDGGQ